MPSLAVTFGNFAGRRRLSGHPAVFVKPEAPAEPAWPVGFCSPFVPKARGKVTAGQRRKPPVLLSLLPGTQPEDV